MSAPLTSYGPVQADHQRPVRVGARPAPCTGRSRPRCCRPARSATQLLSTTLPARAGRPDGHRHVPLRAGVGVQPEQVRARRASRRSGTSQHRVPVGADRVGRRRPGRPPSARRAAQRPGLPDLARAVPLVPAEPERGHPEAARGGGDEQRERLARSARWPCPRTPRSRARAPRWRIAQCGSPGSEFSATAPSPRRRGRRRPAGGAARGCRCCTRTRRPATPSAPKPRNARLLVPPGPVPSRVMADRMHPQRPFRKRHTISGR